MCKSKDRFRPHTQMYSQIPVMTLCFSQDIKSSETIYFSFEPSEVNTYFKTCKQTNKTLLYVYGTIDLCK